MTLPAESPRPAALGGRSVIAQDVRIKGDLGSDGIVEVMGEIEGKITARTLVIGAEGYVKGAVMAETVDVRGRMDGRISCVTLTLRAAAQVKADSSYSTLSIESGATVDGRFSKSKA